MDKESLIRVLSYVIENEYNHYLESDMDEEHVYIKALECLNALLNEMVQS